MSRSGYTYDGDPLDTGRWRAIIASATRGKRGQVFFKALVEALDELKEKKLIKGNLKDESGCVCALGALAMVRGVDPNNLDTYDYPELGKTFNIAPQLAQEVMEENDRGNLTPELRWQLVREWAAKQIRS